MAGTFTRSTFYKLDTSPNARVEYTGVTDVSPYLYRVVDRQATAGALIYAGGAALAYSSPAIRTISPTTNLSPTWPRTAGSPVTVWVQENIKGAGFLSPATSSAVVLAITNPAVSGTQTFATTAAATISHSPALSTQGAGGTLQFWATNASPLVYSPLGWTISPLTLNRGDRVYLGARRGVGVSTNEDQFSVYNGPFDVPFISPNYNINVSPEKTEITGGNTSPVTVAWTTTSGNTYRVLRTDTGNTIVIPLTSAASGTLSPNGAELPSPGLQGEYKIQVRRTTATGGDGVFYDATSGTNITFSITRIGAPVLDDTQNFNVSSPTPISHTIELKSTGVGGNLQYGWHTTNNVANVTNWQSPPTFNNAFSRNSPAYYFFARRSTDLADYDVSTAQTVPSELVTGLRVWNNAGNKVVFDTNVLVTNFITCKVSGTAATGWAISPGTFVDVTVPGLTASNGSTVFFCINGPYNQATGYPTYSPTRNTGFVRINNSTASNITVSFYAGRYK
jgi:hypothetical protein